MECVNTSGIKSTLLLLLWFLQIIVPLVHCYIFYPLRIALVLLVNHMGKPSGNAVVLYYGGAFFDSWLGTPAVLKFFVVFVSPCSRISVMLFFYCLLLAIRRITIDVKLMCNCDTVAWWGVHPAMSPQVPCKSKGQHVFSLLLYAGCSSGCNSGLGCSSNLVWCFPILSWMTSRT
jgi:hypothetical protein